MEPDSDLPMWVVYCHPSDFPEYYVARQHVVGIGGQQPTDRVMLAATLESLRVALSAVGLLCIERNESDDPVIVETWL